MEHHVGIHVSLELSSLCVLDATGKVIREAKFSNEPEALVRRDRPTSLLDRRRSHHGGDTPLRQFPHNSLRHDEMHLEGTDLSSRSSLAGERPKKRPNFATRAHKIAASPATNSGPSCPRSCGGEGAHLGPRGSPVQGWGTPKPWQTRDPARR